MLVKKLQIPVTQKGIVNELQRQQDPSSLLAISDIFDNWNIAHAAYNARVGELLETEIPLPFIACFKNGEFVLVTKINKDSFIVSNDRWNNFRLEIQDFKKHYQGTILAFEKDASSGEADYPSKRRTEIVNSLRFPFIISGLTMVLILFLLANQNYIFPLKINIGLLLLFKSTGVAISILLLIKSLDANNSFVKKICGSDENQNCNAILASKTAKITDELSWSEVGFFYFAGTWLALLFNNDSGLIRILAIINLL
ncbi:MAG TPA: cysteine peptidase family C39 domain-containing protein, partial [Mucilaginibacter sp.]|nr:cysteine peptidase family C39 domain-containing protein [Mucilaginibacter sp.]